MTKRLNDGDRRAVDLLLDLPAGGGNGSVAQAHSAEPGIQTVGRVLTLLDLLPSEDPPADLLARTTARIDERVRTAPPSQPAAALATNRPHA